MDFDPCIDMAPIHMNSIDMSLIDMNSIDMSSGSATLLTKLIETG